MWYPDVTLIELRFHTTIRKTRIQQAPILLRLVYMFRQRNTKQTSSTLSVVGYKNESEVVPTNQ